MRLDAPHPHEADYAAGETTDALILLLPSRDQRLVLSRPFRELVTAFGATFVVFVFVVVGARWMSAASARTATLDRLHESLQSITRTSAHAPPAHLLILVQEWADIDRQLSDVASDRESAARAATGGALLDRNVALLGAPDLITVGEGAILARTAHDLWRDTAVRTASRLTDSAVAAGIAMAVERGTNAIVLLGRQGATASQLREAAMIATDLAAVVPVAAAQDYLGAAAALNGRAQADPTDSVRKSKPLSGSVR